MTLARSDSTSLSGPRYELAWAMLVCAIAALTLAYPALSGEFLVNHRSDQYIAGYAFREYAADMLRTQGQFPLWNPYLLGGLPYVDAMHGDIFYPTFLLRMILPTDAAMTWGMILHFWLAGVAAFAFFRAHRLPFYASLIGGVAYMMSGMVAGLVSPGHDGKLFITALLPLTMLVIRAGVRDGRRWAWGVLALVTGLGILTPHPQLFQYLLLASGAYALWVALWEGGDGAPTRRVGVQRLGIALGAIAIGFAIGAIQFWPVMQYVNVSPRAGGAGWEHAISFSMPPEEWISAIIPEFTGILDNYWGRNSIHFHSEYLGFPAILLALAAFSRGSAAGVRSSDATEAQRRRMVWFFTGMLAISALWAMGKYTPFYSMLYAVGFPGVKYFRAPSTMMFVSSFAVATLAAIGASRVLAGEVSKRYFTIAAVVLGLVTVLGVSGGLSGMASGIPDQDHFPAFEANRSAVPLGTMRMLLFAAAAFGVIYAGARKKLAPAMAGGALAAIIAADLWSIERHYWQFIAPASTSFASDPAIERIKSDSTVGRVIAIESPRQTRDPFLNYDGLMAHKVRTVMGYQGNAIKRYEALIGEGGMGILSPEGLEMLNVQWIYTNVDSLPLPGFDKVVGPVKNAFGSTVNLFRAQKENPLSWVVPAIVKAPDEVTLATLASPGYPVRSVALFDTASSAPSEQLSTAPAALAIRARTVRYAPGSIDIELDSAAPAKSALVVSENFYKGWMATVDGNPVEVSRANYTFIGVPLPAGAKRIELRFTSPTYHTGKMVTLLSLGIALVLMIGGFVLDRKAIRD